MIDPYLQRLAEDWIGTFGGKNAFSHPPKSRTNPFTAFQAIVNGDPIYAWSLISMVVEMDKEMQSLDILAAAPLEDFLSIHGKSMIDYIEDDILRSERLQKVLRKVRKSGIDDAVWERLQQMRYPE